MAVGCDLDIVERRECYRSSVKGHPVADRVVRNPTIDTIRFPGGDLGESANRVQDGRSEPWSATPSSPS